MDLRHSARREHSEVCSIGSLAEELESGLKHTPDFVPGGWPDRTGGISVDTRAFVVFGELLTLPDTLLDLDDEAELLRGLLELLSTPLR